ncbi:DNA-binding CsgD family transcriptional regulator/tetratricopeptide (TPR) repeat protein [Crossiella equi]|uniref:DNA-binding CsgD family transcriptional regulator/tetratricopeptide (TPR) repeat protein n=1 Tax=Crossiella equi TaxID=130796 RepID=A0ABS5AD02_9PSEU|nr:LuxR family transcriptional regulator [Crossiella equi]MBP2474473.1 DNA-binding CsgD family transcriptional regulator/tetratricopeptide (TPR) repeat protein [Crossiella equi]
MAQENGLRTSSPVLVGRHRELGILAEAVARPPALALLEGEAGIGKTRLVRELLGRTGTPALLGHCQPLREPFPYGPVLEALGALGPRLTGGLNPVTGVLRPLLPEIAAKLPPQPEPLGDPAGERHRLFRAVRELLVAAGPVLLVVEDLHWADDGTREVLRFLLDSPPPETSVVLTYRREDLGGALLGSAFRPAHGVSAAVLRLSPLDVAGVRELANAILGTAPAAGFAARLHERTAGIPFVVEEALHALHDTEGGLRTATARRLLDHLRVPVLLREATTERLAALDPLSAKVVRTAAVLGVPAEEDLLAAVVGASPEEVATALVQALAATVLHELPGRRYGFRHSLAREAVYDTITGPERRQLHARAAAELAGAEPTPWMQLARHSRESGQRADWLRHTEAAADQAGAVGEAGLATELYRQLVEAPELTTPDVDRIAGKLGAAAVLGVEQLDDSAVLRRVLADPRLSPAARGTARLNLGFLLVRETGGLAEGHRDIEAAIEELGARSALGAKAMSVLAQPFRGTVPLADNLRWMARVQEAIDSDIDPDLRLNLLANQLGSRVHIGDGTVGPDLARLPRQAASPLGRQHLTRAFCNLGDAYATTGHYRQAREWLAPGLRMAGELGMPFIVSVARATQARLDFSTGTWTGLAQRCARMLEDYRDLRPVATEISLVLGQLAVARGEWPEAERHLGATGLDTPDDAFTPVVMVASAAYTQMLLSREEDESALAHAELGLSIVRRKEIWLWAAELLPLAVRAYLRTGRLPAAVELLATFTERTRDRDAPLASAAALAGEGLLLGAQGRLTAGARALCAAAAAYAALPNPYLAAQARQEAARLRLEAGRPAEPELAEAASAFDGLGATRDAAACRHLLRERGLPAPAPAASARRGRRGYGAELSPREREVARLLGRGRTNREIAEVLFLSPRTVEQHVAKVLRKLGVSSRSDLVDLTR